MHALITGGGGFVGRHVADGFLAAGWRVTAVRRGPARFREPGGIAVVQADLRNPGSLPDRYDTLVHCAAEIPAYCPDPDALYAGNINAARSVFEHAAFAGATRLINLSSMSVYGRINVAAVNERAPLAATDAYGRAKAAIEAMAAEWAENHGRCAVSIRLPGVVGAGSHDNFLSNAMQCLLSGGTLTARNPEALFNNVVWVTDLVRFMQRLAAGMPRGHRALTIASTAPLKMRDVLHLLASGTGRPLELRWSDGGSPPFLIEFGQACALGFEPSTVADSIAGYSRDTLAALATAAAVT